MSLPLDRILRMFKIKRRHWVSLFYFDFNVITTGVYIKYVSSYFEIHILSHSKEFLFLLSFKNQNFIFCIYQLNVTK